MFFNLKKLNKLIGYILYLFIILFFIACGGGGEDFSTSSTDTNSSSQDTNTSNNTNQKVDLKTQLLDDEFSKYQWHRTAMNLDELNKTYNGYNSSTKKSIKIQVVDNGVDAYHNDLKDNLDLASSYNVRYGDTDPTPESSAYSHGTKVAGVIAAVGYNTIGLKGIAPSATLSGFALRTYGASFSTTLDILQKAWYSGVDANNIAISNNSWGSCVSKDEDEEALLRLGSLNLRDGKGRIYVFSGGNDRIGTVSCQKASSNASYLTNSQYSIAVAAVNQNDKIAYYSSPGANILVSAYSGGRLIKGLSTTVPHGSASNYGNETWQEDLNNDKSYTNNFSGTSAAAPVVSGSLALVLDACPDLTYRDIKYLIATNSKKIDTTNSSWVTNSAGLSHSNDYGFGLIDPEAIIKKCKSNYTNLSVQKRFTTSDNNTSVISNITVERVLQVSENISIEWVGLKVTTNYNKPRFLQIKLISPSGTISELIHSDNQFNESSTQSQLVSGFRFSSQTFMGENSIGEWKVQVISFSALGSGDLTNLELEVVGY